MVSTKHLPALHFEEGNSITKPFLLWADAGGQETLPLTIDLDNATEDETQHISLYFRWKMSPNGRAAVTGDSYVQGTDVKDAIEQMLSEIYNSMHEIIFEKKPFSPTDKWH